MRVLARCTAGAALALSAFAGPENQAFAGDHLAFELVARYETGLFDQSAAEVVAYAPEKTRLFVVNAAAASIDMLDIADPAAPEHLGTLSLHGHGGGATSVAAQSGIVAVSLAADDREAPGKVVFFDLDGSEQAAVEVGSLPDMVAFTPDGRYVLTANEGEPSDDYASDPVGSISIVDLAGGLSALGPASVRTAGFEAFNGAAPDGVRVFGPGASVAQDLEPEYIAVSEDGRTAWVTLQENNALAIVDIEAAEVTRLVPLGTKDHSLSGLDPSNKDGGIFIRPWPVLGLYQPDAIAAYEADGQTLLVTANEGDARDYPGYSEETRVQDLKLDPQAFPNAEDLQAPAALGRLKTTTATGDVDGDGDHDAIYAFGSRSIAIWDADGQLVWDSGDAMERITAERLPNAFNSANDENDSFDARSDDKGPEPEGVTIGRIGERVFAFVGLERVGGIMAFDVTDPAAPAFAGYVTSRDFIGTASAGTAGDLGPEGLAFIPADLAPGGEALLVVGNEISGSTAIYKVAR